MPALERSRSFGTVLIANRGEIACRVIRSAKALGYRTVAVFSEADESALHVSLADEATCIGPPPVRESYLNIEAIIAAARRTGADAVHPGYGFLSENDGFARACDEAGLVFIGPPAAAIAAMGNKSQSKRLMIEAGVPTIPGWPGAAGGAQDEATLSTAAEAVGYPLLIKAAAGGGGRGMRLVRSTEEFLSSLRTARAEAQSAFGSGEMLLERALLSARHVEIQVFADQHGSVIHLGERDCSIQRRHQKIVEESPSPAVTPQLRARMGAAAVAAARSIGYVGAGTVEFLLDEDGSFFFLEMNTRLQVEHPVTECVTGLDLVALQLDVAAGKKLPLTQDQVHLRGHAIEVRLYAEDPFAGFLPQTGRVLRWQPGVADSDGHRSADGTTNGLRVDHGLVEGQAISPWYDPMLAKLIAHGADREEARRKLLRLVEDTTLLGTITNKTFLGQVLAHPSFVRGEATTGFIPTFFTPDGSESVARPAIESWTLATAAVLLSTSPSDPRKPFETATTGESEWSLRIACGGDKKNVVVRVLSPGSVEVMLDGSRVALRIVDQTADRIRVLVDGVLRTARFARRDAQLFLDLGLRTVEIEELPSFDAGRENAAGDGRVLASMNGRIVGVHVEAGARVARGQLVVTLEAMKMQHQILADSDGTVAEVLVAVNDQVAPRKLLVRITP